MTNEPVDEATRIARNAYLLGQLTIDLLESGYAIITADPATATLIMLTSVPSLIDATIELTLKEIEQPPPD